MLRAVLHHLLLVLVVSCWAMSARAQATGADVLFDQGRKLYTAGKYEEAAEKFRESQRLDPAPGTLLNLAECYVKLGKTASGWSTFREAAALAATRQQPKREKYARDKATALEPTLSRLTIVVPDAARVDGLQIQRGDRQVDPALWGVAVPVDPGTVEVVASAPGHVAWRKQIQVDPGGAKLELAIPPLEGAAPVPSPAPTPAPPAEPPVSPPPAQPAPSPVEEEPGASRRLAGLVLGGVGLAGLGIGTGLYIASQSTIDDANCPDSVCVEGVGDPDQHEEGRSQEKRSFIVLGLGGALAVTGVVLVLTAPSKSSETSARLRFTPTPGGAHVGLSGRF